jgi:L-alanine-DL-glutamate epimerase-like enolase superfamily enzyme
MKIASARVIVTCPGRNFVTLKIETDDGLTGIGDATLNGRELAVASYLAASARIFAARSSLARNRRIQSRSSLIPDLPR